MCDGHFSMSANVALASSSATVRISIALQEAPYKSHGSCFLSISGFPRYVETYPKPSRQWGSKHSVYLSAAPLPVDLVEGR